MCVVQTFHGERILTGMSGEYIYALMSKNELVGRLRNVAAVRKQLLPVEMELCTGRSSSEIPKSRGPLTLGEQKRTVQEQYDA